MQVSVDMGRYVQGPERVLGHPRRETRARTGEVGGRCWGDPRKDAGRGGPFRIGTG
jgi:hypothetical protein